MTVIGYHLIDPKQSGLEEKVKAFIRNSELEQTLEHRFVRLETGVLMAQHLDTKLIVSYLSISWGTFPFFVTLRAVNPQAKIVHVEFAQSGHPNFDLEKKDSRSNSLLRCTYALFDRIIVANQGEAHRFKAAALASDKNIEILTRSLKA